MRLYCKLIQTVILCLLITESFSKDTTISSKIDQDSITIRIVDSLTQHPISDVNSYLSSSIKATVLGISDSLGIIKLIAKNNFRGTAIKLTHLSYKEKVIYLNNDGNKLLTVKLSPKITILDSIVVSSMTKVQPDTVTLKLDSAATVRYKMDKAITSLDGFRIQDGTLFYNLKPISKVLVNGEVFFYSDPTELLTLLPAYIIDKVKVYDTVDSIQTDQNQTTYTELNLITYKDKTNGFFGDLIGSYGQLNTNDLGYNLFLTYNKNKIHSRFSRNNIGRVWNADLLTLKNIQPVENQLFNDLSVSHINNGIKNITISNNLSYSKEKNKSFDEQLDSTYRDGIVSKFNSQNYSDIENESIHYVLSVLYRMDNTQINANPSFTSSNFSSFYSKQMYQDLDIAYSETRNLMRTKSFSIPITQSIHFPKRKGSLLASLNLRNGETQLRDSLVQNDSVSSSNLKVNRTNNFSSNIQYSERLLNFLTAGIGNKYTVNKSRNTNTVTDSTVESMDTSIGEYSNTNITNYLNLNFHNKTTNVNGAISSNNIRESDYNFDDSTNYRKYHNLSFNLNASYLKKAWDIKGSYDRNNIFPSIRQITSFPIVLNHSTVYIGNSNLAAGDLTTWNISISHSEPEKQHSVNVTINSNSSKDGIQEVSRLIERDTSINGVPLSPGMVVISPVSGIDHKQNNLNLGLFLQNFLFNHSHTNINMNIAQSDTRYGNENDEKRSSIMFAYNFQYNILPVKINIKYQFGLDIYSTKFSDNQKNSQNAVIARIDYKGLSLFNIESNTMYTYNRYPSATPFNQVYWNINIYKQVLTNQKLKIQCAINNILNAKTDFRYIINNNISSQKTTYINGRFWIISLSYNISKFGF